MGDTEVPGDVLAVSEIFGPTIQGEGRAAGTPAMFVRLARCNLDCVWCDTKYTWDWEHYDPKVEVHRMSVDAIVDDVERWAGTDPDMIVVLTGGEPLLQARNVRRLCGALRWPVHVETNGTCPPVDGVAWYNVSPKLLPSARVELARAFRPNTLRALARQPSAVKLVYDPAIDTPTALADALILLGECGYRNDRVDLMPEGATPDALDRNAAAVGTIAAEVGLGSSPRLHVSELGGGRGI